jgi:hypothetical protein
MGYSGTILFPGHHTGNILTSYQIKNVLLDHVLFLFGQQNEQQTQTKKWQL